MRFKWVAPRNLPSHRDGRFFLYGGAATISGAGAFDPLSGVPRCAKGREAQPGWYRGASVPRLGTDALFSSRTILH